MNQTEFLKAIKLVCKEKGIHEDVLFEAMTLALSAAYKKNFEKRSNVRIDINKKTGAISIYSRYLVVEDVIDIYNDLDEDEEENFEPITLDAAKAINPNYQIGDIIEREEDAKDFGRIAAQTAKQVVMQKIREAERELIYQEFKALEFDLVMGTVLLEDNRNYYVDLGRTRGILTKNEIIPNEKIVMGAPIKAFLMKLENTPKGAVIFLSRKHPGFIKRVFENEIPEINDGTLEIMNVARDAGERTKISILSNDKYVEAIGTCIGPKGVRIGNILKELNGEKVDLVEYSNIPEQYIINALSPAEVSKVTITDLKEKKSLVYVVESQLSLAIGKQGQNARLAARLTSWKIDIKTL